MFFHYNSKAWFITLKCCQWQLYHFNGHITHNLFDFSDFKRLFHFIIHVHAYPKWQLFTIEKIRSFHISCWQQLSSWSVSDKLSPQYDQRTVRHLNMGPMNQIAHQSSRNQIPLSTDYSFNKSYLSKFLFSVLSITEDFKTYKLTYYMYYLEYWNLIQNHNLDLSNCHNFSS